MKQNRIYIYGKHAVREAIINAPHALDRVFLTKENDDRVLLELIKKSGITMSVLGSDKSFQNTKNKEVHQGVVGRVLVDKLVQSYDKYISSLNINENTVLLILGEIEDPQNVGAIIRSAAAFGVSGVLIPKHNQAPITGAVIKVSAGMAFRTPLVEVGNINNTIRDLKKLGFWIYGLDGNAEQTISEESYDKPTVFILGNESQGIRQKTRELCDKLLSIPIDSKCESLNVAASAAVTLFAWNSQRKDSLDS